MGRHIIEFEDVKAETVTSHFASSSTEKKMLKVVVLLAQNSVVYHIYHNGAIAVRTADFKKAIEEYNTIA